MLKTRTNIPGEEHTMSKIFIGKIIHSTIPFSVTSIDKGYIIIKNDKIIAVGPEHNLENHKNVLGLKEYEEIVLTNSQILIPGLIDTHIHAPQYPNIGLGYDLPLLDWLDNYTYKLEEKYSDLEFSKKVYDAVVQKTLQYGTTTACYYGSLYKESCLILVDSVIKFGQRAFVGKVNMTKLAPKTYIETPEDSLKNTELFIKEVLNKKNSLVQPVITPRFALSVDLDLMSQLAELAKKYNLNIQTHISENVEEIRKVKGEYKCNYPEVYDKANLLTKKTVLAHGVHLTKDEAQLIASRGSSISHCAASNTKLQSGACDVKFLTENGVNVGLGTDIAGGNCASIIDAMRSALDTSIHLSFHREGYKPIDCNYSFYLATLGGAKALALDDKIGNFEVGKEFDALIVDMNVENCSAHLLQDYSTLELLQKFINVGDDRNIKAVYVAGRKV